MRSLAIVWAIIGSCACRPPSSGPDAATIYAELVEAGCVEQTDSGLAATAAGLASDAQPPWFSCLAAGGTVASCAMPCDR